MTRAFTLAVILGVGVLAAFEAPLGLGADPAPTPATVTVQARVEGHDAVWWRAHSARNYRWYTQADRDRDVRGRTIRRLKHAAKADASSGLFGTIRAFLCIHSGEGPWDANTGNGYENGLQMDRQFQRTYGAWALQRFGAAYRWPPEVQLVVALTAYYSGRGFRPWPNTARMCGLL